MPRPPRDLAPGIQHIGVSANGPAAYFRDELDYVIWTRLFVRTIAKHGWTCIALCLLTTHWHGIVEVYDDSLAAGMQVLTGQYSRRFNDRHTRVGYLVRDRYWSRRKSSADELLNAFKYVARNPCEAGLVKRPEEWRYSSYAATIGLAETFSFVDAGVVLAEFGGVSPAGIAALRRFVETD
jgi:putative transposase